MFVYRRWIESRGQALHGSVVVMMADEEMKHDWSKNISTNQAAILVLQFLTTPVRTAVTAHFIMDNEYFR